MYSCCVNQPPVNGSWERGVRESTRHIPVMEQEVISYLQAQQGGVFLDCTLGGGGHSAAILAANIDNQVYAFDRDQAAIERGVERFAAERDRIKIEQMAFSQIGDRLAGQTFDGVVVDLGVSTDQLRTGRGFSFSESAPLDMRMDQSSALSAELLVNESGERELYQIFKQGGVGREARLVAAAIVKARPIRDSRELGQLVARAAAAVSTKRNIHPATVVFQAIRMAVNREREELEALLQSSPGLVKSGGRLVVLTFHSIEDQLVTAKMRSWAGSKAAPANWRGSSKAKVLGRLIEKRAVKPSPQELDRNPAARSARLRVFEFV